MDIPQFLEFVGNLKYHGGLVGLILKLIFRSQILPKGVELSMILITDKYNIPVPESQEYQFVTLHASETFLKFALLRAAYIPDNEH